MEMNTFFNEMIGGLLIGLGSALPLLWQGRIAGISGYASSALRPLGSKESQNAGVLVLGLLFGAPLIGALPSGVDFSGPFGVWAIGGLMVGFGSRLAGGCTSGHGVCGLGRFSLRSLVAVGVFMGIAILIQTVGSLIL
jgi:uncharacterized membrane protein YedE/YeeE